MSTPDALETALVEAFAVEARTLSALEAARKSRIAIEAAMGRGEAAGPLIPLKVAALDWSVSDDTVRRWAIAGDIRAERLGSRWHVQAEKPTHMRFLPK